MKKSDVKYAYAIRQALIEQTNRLPAATDNRLLNARRMAIARHGETKKASLPIRSVLNWASAGKWTARTSRWLFGITAISPIVVGMILLIGLYHFELEKRIADIAELDAAVLADELPLSAYVDQGFKVFAMEGGE